MKKLLPLVFLLMACNGQVQDEAYIQEITQYQEEINTEFLDPILSPLNETQIAGFDGHDFFAIDEGFRVKAKFEATPEAKPFPLKTNTGATQIYRRLGILHFSIDDESLTLEAYLKVQSFGMASKVNFVFLPVVDLTTGNSTYGAGRYLHFEGIPEGEEWVIDFNKLYNPLCAYDQQYECPLVPQANHLPIAIKAGMKDYK